MLNAAALKKRLAQAMAERPEIKQARIAEATGKTPQAVSAWVKTGQIDPTHFPTLSQLFGKPIGFWYGEEASTVVSLPSQTAGRSELSIDVAGETADDIAEFLGIDRSSRQYLVLFEKIHRRLKPALEAEVPANVARLASKPTEETSNAARGPEEEAGAGAGRGHQRAAARKPGARGKRK